MKFEKKIFWMRQKYYFDIGVGMTSLLIKILAVVGIAAAIEGFNKWAIVLYGLGYGVFCYLFGYLFIRYTWYTASIEVQNRLNLFVKEMRKNYKG